MLSNKGQIAETITWVVATVIIFVTLVIFIFLSVSVSEAKNLSISGVVEKVGGFLISDDIKGIERFKVKTIFASSLNDNNYEKIEGWLESE